MKAKHILAGLALGAVASAGFAQTLASTSFDSGEDGWTVKNGATNFHWMSGGGDPAGFVEASDVGGHMLWFFDAPSTYLGNMSSAYGGTLSFELKSDPTSPPLGGYAGVQLLGANGVLLALAGSGSPGTDWTSYSVNIAANGSWKLGSTSGVTATAADMQGVLANLKSLRINGDYKQAIETTALDSVVLSVPVPEPTSAALLLVGLGAMGTLVLRRRRDGTS